MRILFCLLALVILLTSCKQPDPIENHYRGEGKYFGPERSNSAQGLVDDQTQVFRSKHLNCEILVPVGVYDPTESELEVLPFLKENIDLFKGKRVLEVGTGSGIISLYMAKNGASSLVATDISGEAVAAAQNNALTLSLQQVEVRRVDTLDQGAYSVTKPGEQFDLIVSNPPWVLNPTQDKNSAVEDGKLVSLSIIDGLEEHLAPEGRAILFCNTYYSHKVLVKYAKALGFEVSSHLPNRVVAWEAEMLFNHHSQSLEKASGSAKGSLEFSWREELEAATIRLEPTDAQPLISGNSQKQYPGMILIRRSQ